MVIAAGRSPVSEAVLPVGFFILLEGEIEVWQRVLGSTMTYRHTLQQPPALFAVWLSLYALKLTGLVRFASYVLHRRGDLRAHRGRVRRPRPHRA